MKYEVIEMYGQNEPWWFFEGWEGDVVQKQAFSTFEQADKFFHESFMGLKEQYSNVRTKPSFLAAFWNKGELDFCEDCDDDVQLYRGLLMLADGKKIVFDGKEQHETVNYCGEAKCCKRPS